MPTDVADERCAAAGTAALRLVGVRTGGLTPNTDGSGSTVQIEISGAAAELNGQIPEASNAASRSTRAPSP